MPSNGRTPEEHAAYHRAYYHRNKEKAAARMKAYREANVDALWSANIHRKYGITAEDFYARFKGVCEICAVPVNRPLSGGDKANDACIDHDHATGLFRGILCHKCNRALGLFRDDPDLLKEAAHYLENA